jgi:Gpi18-like mannosyltransferase
MFCKYDCYWYLTIIEDGYMDTVLTSGHAGAANWAFFPVFPLTVKFLAFLFPINPILIGILLNNLVFFFFLLVVNRYLAKKFNDFDYKSFTILYCFSPFSIYFNSLYTETIYIFLIAALIFLLQNQRMLAAGAAGALLSGTRVTGISFLTLYAIQVMRDFLSSRSVKTGTWIGLFVFPIGLIAFSLFLFFTIGDPFGYITIQEAWGFGNLSFIDWLLNISSSGSMIPWAYLASIIAALGGAIYFLTRKSYTEAFILSIPVITSVISVAINFRYFFVLYPFYLILSRLIASNKWLKVPLYVGTTVSSILLINAWLAGAGYLV